MAARVKFWKTEKVRVFDHEAFAAARAQRKISAYKIAMMVQVQAPYIYMVESGKRIPTTEMAEKLIAALKELS